MLMTTVGVTRFEDVTSFIAAVKKIRETTECAWVFVDDTVAIPEEIARMVTYPVFGKNSKWSVIHSLKETMENGLNITFNIEADMHSLAFLGMQE